MGTEFRFFHAHFQSTVSSLAQNVQASSSICAEQPSQSVSRTVQDSSTGVESQPPPVEPKPSTRMELPAVKQHS